MATKDKKQDKKQDKQDKRKGGEQVGAAAAEHTGVGIPAPPPRLKTYYEGTVRGRLQQQFALANVHEIPKLKKIVLNVGVGEAVKQPKLLDSVVEELGQITGQKAVRTRAKKSISNFGLRQGQDITFVTSTDRDDRAFALLRELGMPFRGEEKPIVANL